MPVKVLGKHDDAPYSIFVTRNRSILGNPFIIGLDGTRDEVIELFRGYLAKEMKDVSSDIAEYINQLAKESFQGKMINLRCVCKPKACHGDVIKETIDRIVAELKIMNIFDASNDGITHINAYSKGKTKLGRQLSNFYVRPFKYKSHTVQCIEGLWYYLATGEKHPHLLNMDGITAKNVGRGYTKTVDTEDPKGDFLKTIAKAIHVKIVRNPDIRDALRESTLPIVHYYVNDKSDSALAGESSWFTSVLEHERNLLKAKASLQLDITED